MLRLETYPSNFENKVGFDEVRHILKSYASSSIGKEYADQMGATTEFAEVDRLLSEVVEMMDIKQHASEFPSLLIADKRESLNSLRPQGAYLEEKELLDIADTLAVANALDVFFHSNNAPGEDAQHLYPHLKLIADECPAYPKIESNIRSLFDITGKIKDNASKELYRIRKELNQLEKSLSGSIHRIIREAKKEGWVEGDVNPSIRDGRLVIPIAPAHKRKIKGIIHDESTTGKTVYIEPAEIVEANNRITELETEERKEIIRILIEVANKIRPHIQELIFLFLIIGKFDFIMAKACFAIEHGAIKPILHKKPTIQWYQAKHPLLLRTLKLHQRDIVPLDIELLYPDSRILIISGPNAGGKSVCLKTVGILQYMLQCGMPIPVSNYSHAGIFGHLFIDIGDEQSIEDDLSTYSSHLRNMKYFTRNCNSHSLLLIDEFGGGTEPQIGGAIAQALLRKFNDNKSFGVITTHYQNIKNYAEDTLGLINGAMLYDRHEMKPLFKLAIGRPGSSFAIEIARKTGIPEDVIDEATSIVGTDYIDMDKYLQDIVRDKRYWETKRLSIRKEEKRLVEEVELYKDNLEKIEKERKKIIVEAKKEALQIISDSGKMVERTIREIKEAEAEKEKTKKIRASLDNYKKTLEDVKDSVSEEKDKLKRELEKIKRRQERKKEKQENNRNNPAKTSTTRTGSSEQKTDKQEFKVGDHVKIKSQKAIGSILEIKANGSAVIALGMIKTTIETDRLVHASGQEIKSIKSDIRTTHPNHNAIIDQIHEKRLNFKQDIDVRGMRASEGVQAISYFIDEAVQLGINRVRILHGTGTGALKISIREYLASLAVVKHFQDEHVQFGGAGITIVDL